MSRYRAALGLSTAIALAVSAAVVLTAPSAVASGRDGATVALKVNGATVKEDQTASLPLEVTSTFDFTVLDTASKPIDGKLEFSISKADGAKLVDQAVETKAGKASFTWLSTLAAGATAEGWWCFHAASPSTAWDCHAFTVVGKKPSEADRALETWPAAKVSIPKIGNKKVAPGKKKVTIKAAGKASGSAVIVSKKLTVKKGKKTVVKNKASAKLARGKYKVTTTITYRPSKKETVPSGTTVEAGIKTEATCTFTSVEDFADSFGRIGNRARLMHGLACSGPQFDRVTIGDATETGVRTNTYRGGGYSFTIVSVSGPAGFQQLHGSLTSSSPLIKSDGTTKTVVRTGPLKTAKRTQTVKVR